MLLTTLEKDGAKAEIHMSRKGDSFEVVLFYKRKGMGKETFETLAHAKDFAKHFVYS